MKTRKDYLNDELMTQAEEVADYLSYHDEETGDGYSYAVKAMINQIYLMAELLATLANGIEEMTDNPLFKENING